MKAVVRAALKQARLVLAFERHESQRREKQCAGAITFQSLAKRVEAASGKENDLPNAGVLSALLRWQCRQTQRPSAPERAWPLAPWS